MIEVHRLLWTGVVRRVAAVSVGALALGAGVAFATGGVPAPPKDVIAGKAYGALERNCAGCHQTGMLPPGTAAGGGLGNILALTELARTPGLVRPGLPDASRLYNVALTQERHLDIFNDPAVPEPLADEVQAIRDWITELPLVRCSPASASDGRVVGQAMADALAAGPPETARITRFASVAHLADSCARPDVAARVRQELTGIARKRMGTAPALQAIDPAGHVWRISLREFGLSPAAWDELAARHPVRTPPGLDIPAAVLAATGSAIPLLQADWLVEVLSEAGAGGSVRGTRGDLRELSAGLWLPQGQVARLLTTVTAPLKLAARSLLTGDAIERAKLDALAGALAGRVGAAPAGHDEPLALALWSDKTVYEAGETGVISALASRDCYLTLIGVDKAGRAMVLFPNELEPSHRILAGKVHVVPGEKAQYRFRFKDKGREQIVGVCSETHKAPEGIVHDYDRMRFTVLGDWQLFLREPPALTEARRDDAATDIPRPKQRQRRRGRAPDPNAALAAEAADVQTRTAIEIEIR